MNRLNLIHFFLQLLELIIWFLSSCLYVTLVALVTAHNMLEVSLDFM